MDRLRAFCFPRFFNALLKPPHKCNIFILLLSKLVNHFEKQNYDPHCGLLAKKIIW